MVPDSALPGDVGSNGLPKNHPQEGNKYLFSIDVKHESNHPEMGLSSSAVVSESSNATPSSLILESPITKLSRRRSKVRPNIRFPFILLKMFYLLFDELRSILTFLDARCMHLASLLCQSIPHLRSFD